MKMDYEEECDKLRFQRLAGGDIVSQPPAFSANGEFLFTLSGHVVKVYSSATGEIVRELDSDKHHDLISLQLELKEEDTLVACSVVGIVYRWKWSTGNQISATKLEFSDDAVLTFNLLNMYNTSSNAYAFVTTHRQNDKVHWHVFDTDSGERVNVPSNLGLSEANVKVAVQTNYFHNIVLAQGFRVYFINYKSWDWKSLNNAYKIPVTAVTVHPTEELVATGDESGKIFLWRQFMDHRTVTTSLYHWHHTAITSIAFSAVGKSFYSSGLERVLVKWNIDRQNWRNFVPRICAVILHIVVNEDNTRVAICTADNGVQFMGNDNELKNTLQDFTYVSDDKTNRPKFPIGLRLNPRNNTLMLNGRTGHLQCYSTYTRRFLYNIDVVAQNMQSLETDKILYDTQVVKAAFNINWMATAEVYNDGEHLPELCLKFWKFDEEAQNYTLNTNIELPHEGGFKALEFSNANQVDNLVCASVGTDNDIRLWSLDESDSIYRKGKVWYCIARKYYKNAPIESISFSQDGSLLAAGCGNTLCIFKADNLKLLAALNSTAGYDGSVQKAQVRVPKHGNQALNGSRKELLEQQKKTLQLFIRLLENKDDMLLKEIRKTLALEHKTKTEMKTKMYFKLDEKRKSVIYQKVMQMHELNLWQKVLLYQNLGISCLVHPQWQERMLAYIKANVAPTLIKKKTSYLHAQVQRINMQERFKAKYRLHRYTCSKKHYDNEIAQHLVPIMSILNLTDNTKPIDNIKSNGLEHDKEAVETAEAISDETVLPPPHRPAQLKHVNFAAGEYAHMVIVCSESRVLIWNLLTLRLQSILKLSVKHIAFDVQCNLVAAITQSNELHVFQPNVPLPIYQRRNIPNLYGIIWLPRKHMKQRSINVDWQAQSTLYFLTDNQDIIYLSTPNDNVDDNVPLLTPSSESFTSQYTTFGTYAAKQQSEKTASTKLYTGPVVMGNTALQAVKSLLNMSTHTMPPLRLMCYDFVKAIATPIDTTLNSDASEHTVNGHHDNNTHMNGHESSDDDDNDNNDVSLGGDGTTQLITTTETQTQKSNLEKRRAILMKSENIESISKQSSDKINSEAQLKRIAEQFDFDFNILLKQ